MDVPLDDLQIDEIWSKIYCSARVQKEKNLSPEYGDSWTYICIDRPTKLIPAHFVGRRDTEDTNRFLQKVKRAVDTSRRFQVSTDGWAAYRYGVPFELGSNVDFGMLVKKYASSQEVTRYSPAQIISIEKRAVFGTPDPDRICTSHIETANQKLRHLRRFTRLTNGQSKSLRHHVAMQAIYFANYNFCRKHGSLNNCTPAMAAGITDRVWNLLELLG